MTTKCANPACNARFVYFRSGKIFLVPAREVQSRLTSGSPKREMEFFWLCGDCCRTMRLTIQDGAIAVDATGPTLPAAPEQPSAHP